MVRVEFLSRIIFAPQLKGGIVLVVQGRQDPFAHAAKENAYESLWAQPTFIRSPIYKHLSLNACCTLADTVKMYG